MKFRITYLLAALAMGAAMAPPALAVQGCSTAMLNGTFGIQFSGSYGAVPTASLAEMKTSRLTPAQNSPGPVAGIARLYLDGYGNLNGYSAVNTRMAWVVGNVTGSYAVNLDCTATLAITDEGGKVQNFSGVVVGNGQSVMIVQTDPGAAVSGTLRPARGNCQTSDMAGTYGIQASGSVTGSPFSSTGVVSLDGLGNASSAEWRLNGESHSQMASSGSFTINGDCSAALVLNSRADGSTLRYFGLIVYQQAQIPQLLLVRSEPGTPVTGLLAAQ